MKFFNAYYIIDFHTNYWHNIILFYKEKYFVKFFGTAFGTLLLSTTFHIPLNYVVDDFAPAHAAVLGELFNPIHCLRINTTYECLPPAAPLGVIPGSSFTHITNIKIICQANIRTTL